jgi:putative membrane protein
MTCRYLSSTAIVAILVFSATNAFAAKNPTEFITDAIQGDNSEIMLGQMAEEKGGSQQVKDFGKTLAADHSTAKAEASTVAKALGVTPPDTPMAEAKDEQKKLSTMSGDGFDQEFASYMVTDHKKDIQEFQDQAKGDEGQTSALASKQLPVLQKHLKMAQAIAEGASQNGTAAGTLSDMLTQESPDQWRASKLAGVAVYGPGKKDVGKITDVLLSKDGKAELIIIGVGGFLGIGEKDVAVPFDQVKFTDQPMTHPMIPSAPDKAMGGAGAPGATTEVPGSTAPNGTPPRVAATDPAMPAASNTGVSTGDSGAAMPRSTAYPDHGMIDMTADQLKSAPTFHFAR